MSVPVNINMGFGIRSRPTTPLVSLARLRALGVARISLPRFLTAAALSGMKNAMLAMKECMATGELVDRPDLLVGMEEITALMGYDEVSRLEQELVPDDELERKYGQAPREYVIKRPS